MNPLNLIACMAICSTVLAVPLVERSNIAVLSPTSSASWSLGAIEVITWQGSSNDPVNLALVENGQQVQQIAQDLSIAQGSYVWTVPESVSPGSNYQISFSQNGQAAVTSDVFSITLTPTATVTQVIPPSAAVAQNQWTATANITLNGPDGKPRAITQQQVPSSALAMVPSLLWPLALVASVFIHAF
ncbi:hypothetical protein DM01DRAFT_1380173 [Hesseltinella vesiculosa]|uniref:Yeast cell wall synthesis Kre9/Knh1-like N-terminal domain-containing protein n=1 Tax=Hesseltinella vesiculosa TaxID=101127 RepID=A0A1X2GWI8_9FUNG|nr:hypothetical protein DM01DRAFT_1380173 [Hesseltinella vesiculosa]